MKTLLLFSLAGIFAVAAPPVYGPSICVQAQFWNTVGWQSREGDYAYVNVTPSPEAASASN